MSWLDAIRERAGDLLGHARDRDLQEEIALPSRARDGTTDRRRVRPSTARARAHRSLRKSTSRHRRHARRARQLNLWRAACKISDGHSGRCARVRDSPRSHCSRSTLGIGATTVAFTVLDTVLLRPLPYRDAESARLHPREDGEASAAARRRIRTSPSWRDDARSFDGVVSAMYPFSRTVWPSANATDAVRVPLWACRERFFAVLGVRPIVGREFTATKNALGGASAAMVSYEFWQTQMGGRLPLGVVRSGDTPTPVVGVLPAELSIRAAHADVYFPARTGARHRPQRAQLHGGRPAQARRRRSPRRAAT